MVPPHLFFTAAGEFFFFLLFLLLPFNTFVIIAVYLQRNKAGHRYAVQVSDTTMAGMALMQANKNKI